MGKIKVNDEGLARFEAEEFTNEMHDLVDSERKRLNEKTGLLWWADVVFFCRDTNQTVNVIADLGYPQIADLIANTTGETVKRLLVNFFGEVKATEYLEKIVADGRELDALIEKNFGDNGSKVQEQ